MSKAKATWLFLHRWLGLTLGALGILIGLSGAVLLFDHDIDARINPQRYAVSGPQAPLEPAQYADQVRKALPGGRIVNLRYPDEAGGPLVASAREAGGLSRVYLDPPTGRVLDVVPGGGWMLWLHRFHENLTLREYWGRELVGLVGFAMLFSSLSGIYLWWLAPAARSFSRKVHYLLGIYGVLVLAMLSFTGIWLAYVEAGRSLVSLFSAVTPQVRGAGGNVYRVQMREGGDAVTLFVDQKSGEVVRRIAPAQSTPGDAFLAAQRALHTGDAFNLAGRLALFAGGLMPAVLAVTGTLMWLRRRRAAARSAPATLAEESKTLA